MVKLKTGIYNITQKPDLQMHTKGYSDRHLIIVDIQPTTSKYLPFKLSDFINFLNKSNYSHYMYLYVKYGFQGFVDTIEDIKRWLIENGLDNEKMDQFQFIEKDYGWFLQINDFDQLDLAYFVEFLRDNNLSDAKDLTEIHWKEIDNIDLENQIKSGTGNLYLPSKEFMEKFEDIIRAELVGGSLYQCLYEIETLLIALDIPYFINKTFVYR